MKRQSVCYLILTLFAVGLVACGDSGDDDKEQPTKPATQPQTQVPADDGDVKQDQIDFAAEEAAIREVFTLHATAIGTKDTDKIMTYWIQSDSKEVFTAWTFWAGTFEKNEGWKNIKNGWTGIFRLIGGNMTVDISSVAIDARAQNATLRAKYRWAASGELIAALKKEKGVWKIRAIDYTNERFGKQIEEIQKPA
ncbi:hypothetical protein HYR99_02200 [Candidatus Poribacteria bacterium]|nr:hypothetical protein [Candidatus Poribacteria bacterium]